MAPIKNNSKFHRAAQSSSSSFSWSEMLRETDSKVLARRQKQIDYGKGTQGYQNYLNITHKEKRTMKQPRTPDKYQVCSRRNWDGQVKIWRLLLHAYDDDRINGSSADNSIISDEQSENITEESSIMTDSFDEKFSA